MRINIYSEHMLTEGDDQDAGWEEEKLGFIYDRGDFAANRPDFVWQTHKGKFIFPRDMATPHIFNALKMLWNHILDLDGEYKYYPDIKEWSRRYCHKAISAFTEELWTRV